MLTSVHIVWDTRIYHRQAKSLARAGYEVTLIATGVESQKIASENIEIIGIKRSKYRFGRVLNWLRFVKLAIKTDADIYHFHDPDLLFVGLFLKKYTKKPVIYDNHDPYVEAILQREWLPFWLRPIVSKIFDPIERSIANHLSTTIVANDIQKNRFPQAVLVRNYPDIEPFQMVSNGKRESRQLIYAGSISEARGIFDLVVIADFLVHRDINLSVLGPFPNQELAFQVCQLVERHNLQKMVEFEGRVPYHRIVNGLQEASIGLIPFRNVPDHLIIIPTKMFEYMAAGLPIVASDLPPIQRYMAEINCGLLVEPANPRAFAQAIEYLLDNPDEARRMGKNGRRAVIEKYNWSSEAQKLLSLYHTLLHET
jgi:glycosyltransferase involved in cell wall biosynthesis